MWEPPSNNGGRSLAVPKPTEAKTQRAYAKDHAAFCREVIFSEPYRDSLTRRAQDGTLPPGIEALLHYYAVGKPTERVKITKRIETDLSRLSNEELAARAAQLARAALDRAEEMKRLPPANDDDSDILDVTPIEKQHETR